MAIVAEVKVLTMSRPLEEIEFGSSCWVCFRKTCAWHHHVTAQFLPATLIESAFSARPVLCLACRFFPIYWCRKCLKFLSRAQRVYLDAETLLKSCLKWWFGIFCRKTTNVFRWQAIEGWVNLRAISRLGRATACAQRRVLWPCSQQARQEGCNFHWSELTTWLTWIVHFGIVEARFDFLFNWTLWDSKREWISPGCTIERMKIEVCCFKVVGFWVNLQHFCLQVVTHATHAGCQVRSLEVKDVVQKEVAQNSYYTISDLHCGHDI